VRLKSGQSKLVIGNLFLTYYHMTKLKLLQLILKLRKKGLTAKRLVNPTIPAMNWKRPAIFATVRDLLSHDPTKTATSLFWFRHPALSFPFPAACSAPAKYWWRVQPLLL